MLTPDDEAKLRELAERAPHHPVDLRDVAKSPAHAAEFERTMDALVLILGSLKIMFAYEAVPPNWDSMRHLSVSDAGKPPSDELFRSIAEVMGMGAPETWDEVTRTLEKALAERLAARHAFKMP